MRDYISILLIYIHCTLVKYIDYCLKLVFTTARNKKKYGSEKLCPKKTNPDRRS